MFPNIAKNMKSLELLYLSFTMMKCFQKLWTKFYVLIRKIIGCCFNLSKKFRKQVRVFSSINEFMRGMLFYNNKENWEAKCLRFLSSKRSLPSHCSFCSLYFFLHILIVDYFQQELPSSIRNLTGLVVLKLLLE